MPEKEPELDFSTKEGQKELFLDLEEDDQEKIVDAARDEASQIKELVGGKDGPEDYSEAEALLEKGKGEFNLAFMNIRSEAMRDMLTLRKNEITPLVAHKDIAERLVKTTKEYTKLDSQTDVTDENIERYLHDGTIKTVNWRKTKKGEYEREHINAQRLNELLDVVLSRKAKDLRDLDFVLDIIDAESNKFLRNLALKKAVDILQNLPQNLPSISSLYEDNKVSIPKRDFLFTLPLITKQGQIQGDLLKTVTRYHQFSELKPESAAEATYFTALVDLYDPSFQNDMPHIIETLAKDYDLTDSNVAMKLRVIEQAMPDVYAELQEFPPGKPQEADEASRQELIDSYFSEIWDNLPRSEQELVAKDVSTNSSFEELLKKMSAVKLVSPHHFKDLLLTPYHGMEEFNKKTDRAQMDIFRENFEFTGRDKQVLTESTEHNDGEVIIGISDLPKDVSLESESANIPALYREFGNFNALLILLERYRTGPHSNLKPKALRENVVSLLKEAAFHMVKGDFKKWREGIAKSIQGAELEYRAKDGEFWDTWNRDSETKQFSNPVSFHLQKALKKEDPTTRFILAKPEQYLLQPALWKNTAMKEMVADMLKKVKKGDTIMISAKTMLDAVKKRDSGILKQYQLNPKDDANLRGIEKMLTSFIACSELCDVLRDDSLTDDQKQTKSRGILKTIRVDEYLAKPANPQKKGDQNAERGLRFLKGLEGFLGIPRNIEQQRKEGKISVADSSDPADLLTVGQQAHDLINCMNYEGDPNKNAFILDILTSKNKKVMVVKRQGRTVARAVAKILRNEETPDAEPIIIIDDILKGQNVYNYKTEMVEHLQKKFITMPNKVMIGEGVLDPDKNLKRLDELSRKLKNGRITEGQLTQEEQRDVQNFRNERILIGWGTGSRVSAELVETKDSGGSAMPEENVEPVNPRTQKLRTAFYKHFVKEL